MALDSETLHRIGERAAEAMGAQCLTQKEVAGRAGTNERTLRSILRGERTKLSTLMKVCHALSIDPLVAERNPVQIRVAHESYGGYTYEQYSNYIGVYRAFMRRFLHNDDIMCNFYFIDWSDSRQCLTFKEKNHLDLRKYDKEGEIYISPQVGLVNLLTMSTGSVRLVSLTKMRLDDATMRGVVLTPSSQPTCYQPSVSPFYLQKMTVPIEELASGIGVIKPSAPEYEEIHACLTDIERDVAIFALNLPGAGPSYLRIAK